MTGRDARGAAAIFDPRRLKLAREARGLRKNELAGRVGITPAAVSQFELGSARPSPGTLATLGLALGFPVAYFGLGRPLGGLHSGGAHFRSLRTTSQLERDRAGALCELAWELADTIGQRVRLPAYRLPSYPAGADTSAQQIEHIAVQVRADLGLPAGPVAHVVRLLESQGVVVTALLAGVAGVDAFSQPFPDRPVVCLHADRRDGARSRHDGAHELGHLVMHAEAEPGDRVVEDQAQAFAAAFLMPAPMIGPTLAARVRWDHLLNLKACWGVSLASLVQRSRTLGIVGEAAFRRAMAALDTQWGTDEPGRIPLEEPSLFRRAVALLDSPQNPYQAEQLAEEAILPLDLTVALAHLRDDRPILAPSSDADPKALAT